MIEPEKLLGLLQKEFPGSLVKVTDMTGGQDHFEIEVISELFEGLPLLERHRRIHKALEPLMGDEIHAVSLKAYSPSQKRE